MAELLQRPLTEVRRLLDRRELAANSPPSS